MAFKTGSVLKMIYILKYPTLMLQIDDKHEGFERTYIYFCLA